MKLVREFETPFDIEMLCHKLNLLSKKEGIGVNLISYSADIVEGEICFWKRIEEIESEIEEAPEELRGRGTLIVLANSRERFRDSVRKNKLWTAHPIKDCSLS